MTWIFVLFLMFFMFFYEEEKTCFYVFYFQFNVFIIYAHNGHPIESHTWSIERCRCQ